MIKLQLNTMFMKRLLYLLFSLLGAFSLLTSCGDDDEPQPEWSFLYGEWMPAGLVQISGDGMSSGAYLPTRQRLIFDENRVEVIVLEGTDLPWEGGHYTYEVKRTEAGNLLAFSGKEGRFWYNSEEDALYYNVNDPKLYVDLYYVFKRPVEIGSLPIQKRDKNVELMGVSEMPEWMQREVGYRESAPYEGGEIHWTRNRIHQFQYKNKIYYCRFISSHLIEIVYLENGEIVRDYNSETSFNAPDYYPLYWHTTDWKLIYIFPRN